MFFFLETYDHTDDDQLANLAQTQQTATRKQPVHTAKVGDESVEGHRLLVRNQFVRFGRVEGIYDNQVLGRILRFLERR